jgi:sirohydrochlorin ferrochelatase
MGGEALVLIAHGSRDPRHGAAVEALAERVRGQRAGLRVAAAYLDLTAPDVPGLLARLHAGGIEEVVAVPLLLTQAYHAGTDIPAGLRLAAGRLPELRVRQAPVLGPSPLLLAALERRIAEAGVRDRERAATGVVLAAAGSSDPASRSAVAAVAREWQRAGWRVVVPAFASRTALPGTADAVRWLRRAGVGQVVVAPYLLSPGYLADRVAREAREADAVAPVLGDAAEVARVVLERYAQGRTAEVVSGTAVR